VIEVGSFADIEALVDAAWGGPIASPDPRCPSAEAMDAPQDQAGNPTNPVRPEGSPLEPPGRPPRPSTLRLDNRAYLPQAT
jgi:hypothetical protein